VASERGCVRITHWLQVVLVRDLLVLSVTVIVRHILSRVQSKGLRL
jgi:hypothetical protein